MKKLLLLLILLAQSANAYVWTCQAEGPHGVYGIGSGYSRTEAAYTALDYCDAYNRGYAECVVVACW